VSGEDTAVSPIISFDVDNVGVSGSFTQESINYPFVVISDPENILTEYKVSQVSSLVQVSQSEEELSDVSSGAGFAVVVPEYVGDSNDSLLVSFDENYSSEFFGGIPEPSTVFCLGYISREKLGKIIFGNKEKRLILNSIMHPEILRAMREKILEYKKESKIVFVEIQLLFEVQWEKEFDYILLVSSEKSTQVKRILNRDRRSEKEALNIINSQMSLNEKKKRSDYVIENDGNIQDLERKIDEFLKKVVKMNFE